MELRTIAFKNIKRKKSRSFMMMIGLIVAMMTFSTVMLLSAAFKSNVDDQLDQYGFNIIIVPKSSSLSLTYGGINVSGVTTYKAKYLSEKDLARINEVKKDIEMVISPKLLNAVKVEGKPALFVGIDKNNELKIKKWWRSFGEHEDHNHETETKEDMVKDSQEKMSPKDEPKPIEEFLAGVPLSKTDLIVGSQACEALGLNTGDAVNINGQFFRVRAALQKTGSQDDNIIFGDLALSQKLFNKENQYNLVEIMVRDSSDIETVVSELNKKLPNASVSSLKQAVKYKESAMGQLSRFGLVVTLIILGISSMIVFTTMASSVNERASEIGVFRAIGFRKTKIIKIILWEAGLLSAVGGLVGFVLGFILTKLLPFMFKSLNVSAKPDPSILISSIFIATFIGILSSIGPAVKASMLDPSDSLKSL